MKKGVAIYGRTNGTEPELLSDLRRIVESRGDLVVGVFVDDPRIGGKGRNRAWNALIASLDQIEQIVLNDPGDLPGRSVNDVLAILTTLTAHGVAILVLPLNIDTGNGAAAVVALTAAYRAAKRSQAIRRGHQQAKRAGRRIGRPPIPTSVRQRILSVLNAGSGVRATARRFNVSAASVSAIKKTITASPDPLAA